MRLNIGMAQVSGAAKFPGVDPNFYNKFGTLRFV